jgi:hypothetical protein
MTIVHDVFLGVFWVRLVVGSGGVGGVFVLFFWAFWNSIDFSVALDTFNKARVLGCPLALFIWLLVYPCVIA